MQRGGKPTPTPLRLLRGNPGQRALPKGEVQPRVPGTLPQPPKNVARSPHAKEEWERIAPELWRMNILTVADIKPLALYCLAYARWCEAEDALYGDVPEGSPPNLVIDGAMGGKVANPLVKIAASAGLNLMRYAIEFGFTPSSRTRISGTASSDEPKSKFDGLLAS